MKTLKQPPKTFYLSYPKSTSIPGGWNIHWMVLERVSEQNNGWGWSLKLKDFALCYAKRFQMIQPLSVPSHQFLPTWHQTLCLFYGIIRLRQIYHKEGIQGYTKQIE